MLGIVAPYQVLALSSVYPWQVVEMMGKGCLGGQRLLLLHTSHGVLVVQAAVLADGSDPKEVARWQKQQAAEAELAAAEEAVQNGTKVEIGTATGLVFL